MDGFKHFLLWRHERFPGGRYLPLALFLSAPAHGLSLALPGLWALSLLLQARLADDLLSRRRDQGQHPGRVMAQLASSWLMLGICGTLAVVNGAPAAGGGLLVYGVFLLLQAPLFHPSFK